MVRPQRVEYEGAYYHVMNRGQGRQNVYHGERYYEYFLDCLEQAHKRFALEVHAYCLMSNHYHLLVRTPRGNLSRCMRHINGVYVSVRWTHLALRVGEKLRTVDTQHGSNSLTVLVQICEVNTICQQVSDYLLQQGYEMCKVLIRVSGNDCRCVSKGH